MPRLADMMTEDRRAKLARELTHTGTFDNEAIRAQRWNELASAPGQLAQGAFTGLVGAPVDIANMALRPIGLGSDRPVGGSSSLASLIRADERSLPYQAGTMLPISPEGLAIGGAKLAGLIGATKGASKAQDIWKAVDTLQHPAGTIYSPRNKYIANPNYNTGLDVGQQGGLPTRDQYDRIAWEQKIKTKQDQEMFQQEMQAAIDADARRAAERGDVQPSSDVQNQLSDDEWIKQFVQGEPQTRSARQDEAQYLTPEQRLHQYSAPKTEFELAHEVAQRNAALPIEQGGLGLPPNNTAMDRARAMGFDTATLHTSDADIYAFDPVKLGSNTAGNVDSEWAQRLAKSGVWSANEDVSLANRRYLGKEGGMYGDVTYPLLIENPKTTARSLDTLERKLKKGRLKNTTKVNDEEFGVTSYISPDPAKIRSRFAAFDPMQRNSANILAGGAAGAVGLSLLADLLNRQEYQ